MRNEATALSDFRDDKQPVIVELDFRVTRAHEAEKAQQFMYSQQVLRVKKEFQPTKKPATSVYKTCYKDGRLNRLVGFQMKDLVALMEELGIQAKVKTNEE